MGGGQKGGGTNQSLENSQANLANNLSGLMTQQGQDSQQLFNLAFPGMQQADNFYSALASGSPNLISAVTAPAAQQVQTATAGAKKNILATTPAGGERNLALQEADVNQGAQIGSLASQGYTGSFNALGQLGGQGVGLGQGAAGTAVGAANSANSAYSGLINEHVQQKGATLGAVGQGAGDAASLAMLFA